MTYHEHPARILRYSIKNIWLLVFPLIRGLRAFTFNTDAIYRWIKGAWIDIIVLLVILAFGFIQWYFSRIHIGSNTVVHERGVIVRIRRTIPYSRISSVTYEEALWLRPLRAVKLYFDTSAGTSRASDMKIMVSTEVWAKILERLPPDRKEAVNQSKHKPGVWSVIMLSAFFSSSLSGAVYVAAFFFKGGDMARDFISASLGRITEETSHLSGFIIRNIPAAAVGAGVFFLTTWILSFLMNLVRYIRFSISTNQKYIEINCGLLIRRKYKINASHINYADLKQDFLMKITGRVTVSISCAGYGKAKNHIPVLVPVRKLREKEQEASHNYRPKATSLWQYIWQPAVISIALIPVVKLCFGLFPLLQIFGSFLIIMAEIPVLWLIVIRITALLTSGVSISGDKISVQYAKGYMFHTITAEKKRLAKLTITQTPFQKIFRKCTINFFFNGEGSLKHSVKALSSDNAVKIAEELGYKISGKCFQSITA